MSKSGKKPIENAAQVIERFGGIRPMSSKINVPVTTIQGWKKRNVIPAGRREELLETANENNIDLSDLLGDSPAPSSGSPDPDDTPTEKTADTAAEKKTAAQPDSAKQGGETQAAGKAEEKPVPSFVKSEKTAEEKNTGKKAEQALIAHKAAEKDEQSEPKSAGFTDLALETEKKAITKSALISFLLVLLGIGLIVALLWPKVEKVDKQGSRLSALEGDLAGVKEQQALFKGFVPEDWAGQLEDLKAQVAQAKKGVGPALDRVKTASDEILGDHAGSLEDRLIKLESYVQELTESNAVAGVLARMQLMRETVLGRETLDRASQDLAALMETVGEEDHGNLGGILEGARHRSEALGQTFQDVPQEDLKAAAMLLAFTQMRESLNRNATPFEEDLQLLLNMVGKDDPGLRAALERLAPFAKEGVLTPQGLSDEFRTLAGDVVVSSLKGEDVSISEKAKASMNNLFQVEKDGELITGTQTQATVNRAQKLLDQGDVGGALEALKALDEDGRAPLEVWLSQAQSTLMAGQAKDMIREAIDMTAGNGYLGGAQLLDNSGSLSVRKR